MIKRIWMICALLVVSQGVMAVGGIKLVQFGVRAGLNVETVDLLHPNTSLYKLATDDKVGFQLGFTSRINLAMFYIQPELLYNMNRYKLIATPETGSVSKSTVKVNTMEVPVLVGVKILLLHVNAGPVFNVMTNTSVKSGSAAHSVSMVKPTVSYMIGAGLDLGRVSIDARYNGQFKRPEQSILIGTVESVGRDFKTKMQSWTFSVGYMF